MSLWSTATCAQTRPSAVDWRGLAAPVVDGPWLRPARQDGARPVWGHAEGMSVGIAPMPGPRGLLRVYTPYLGQPEGKMINFIAIEPIVRGEKSRGLSELEFSKLDARNGKRFQSVNDPADVDAPPATQPPRGEIINMDGVKALRVYIVVEPFDNGAQVYVRLLFREDRPREVGIATFARPASKPLDKCIITATMGNYARLRVLKLADRTVTAGGLWPLYRDAHFAPHAHFKLQDLERDASGAAIASAWPDEPHPETAGYAPNTRDHWRYRGQLARQYWRVDSPDPALEVLVNGRFVYWNSRAPIPGGISFENFEMTTPFRDGQEFWFGVEAIHDEGDGVMEKSP